MWHVISPAEFYPSSIRTTRSAQPPKILSSTVFFLLHHDLLEESFLWLPPSQPRSLLLFNVHAFHCTMNRLPCTPTLISDHGQNTDLERFSGFKIDALVTWQYWWGHCKPDLLPGMLVVDTSALRCPLKNHALFPPKRYTWPWRCDSCSCNGKRITRIFSQYLINEQISYSIQCILTTWSLANGILNPPISQGVDTKWLHALEYHVITNLLYSLTCLLVRVSMFLTLYPYMPPSSCGILRRCGVSVPKAFMIILLSTSV